MLVVDANAHIRRLIATLLGALEITDVSEARSPSAAASVLAEHRPDLVVVDWTNDPVETLLFVHRIRRGEGADRQVPVLALAASTHHAVLEEAREVGIDDVIAKPISAVDLIHRAAALLDERVNGRMALGAAAQ